MEFIFRSVFDQTVFGDLQPSVQGSTLVTVLSNVIATFARSPNPNRFGAAVEPNPRRVQIPQAIEQADE
jgi:hypothetical protein